MKNHTMPDLPCPVCGTLCRADVVLRHKQAISDSAQNAWQLIETAPKDETVILGRGARGDRFTMYWRGKDHLPHQDKPGWHTNIGVIRVTPTHWMHVPTFPSTGLPAPASHAEVREISDDNRAHEDMTLAHNARKAAIEECARIAERDRCSMKCGDPGCITAKGIAAAIRTLALPQSTECKHPHRTGGGSVGESGWTSYWRCQDCGASGSDRGPPARGDGK